MRKKLANLVRFTAVVALCGAFFPSPASGYTPNSPEVKKLIKAGLKFLEGTTDKRLGGKCVIGLAFIKDKKPNHPKVLEAVEACRAGMKSGKHGGTKDMYSLGMAIIFLCEHHEFARGGHSEMIRNYMGALSKRQKPIGAWGYSFEPIGDNSQTQYGALALWEAHQHGFSPTSTSAKNMAHWLIRVQDPSGGFSYKGEEGTIAKRVEQSKQEMTLSIGAAAMGSTLIAGDLFGLLDATRESDGGEEVSSALREKGQRERNVRPLSAAGVEKQALLKAIRDGDAWMNTNYKVSQDEFQLYYMYSLERYKSFADKFKGVNPSEPEWYNKGVDWLKKNQKDSGAWYGDCGDGVDTGFAVLFLLRSTWQSINKGDRGAMLSGRGLPRKLETLRLSRGELITQRAKTEVDDLVNLLGDEEETDRLNGLIDDPTAFVGKINEKNGRRFEQIVRGGKPVARILAARALGRSGNLNYAPTLIFALTDPDRRVVLEARNGLRFVSRKFGGFGLSDNYKDPQLRDAIERWKKWYLTVRPDDAISLN